ARARCITPRGGRSVNEYKLVDPFLNMPKTPEEAKRNPVTDPNIARWFKDSRVLFEGATFEQMVQNMDEAGIEMGIVTAAPEGDGGRSTWSVGSNVSDEAFEA